MKTKRSDQASQVEYALALAAYRDQQEMMRRLLGKAFHKYGKPQITLEELRDTLDDQLGEVSLSDVVIQMRHEGF